MTGTVLGILAAVALATWIGVRVVRRPRPGGTRHRDGGGGVFEDTWVPSGTDSPWHDDPDNRIRWGTGRAPGGLHIDLGDAVDAPDDAHGTDDRSTP